MVRFKNRYFLIELNWAKQTPPQGVTKDHLASAIRESLRINFGDFGLNAVIQFLQIKYYNEKTNICIVRSSRERFRMVWASLSFITHMENDDVYMRVLHVGGTLKSCQKQAISFDRELVRLMQASEDDLSDEADDPANEKTSKQALDNEKMDADPI
jgi:ribonuclease P/MRP protein subunit POP5